MGVKVVRRYFEDETGKRVAEDINELIERFNRKVNKDKKLGKKEDAKNGR